MQVKSTKIKKKKTPQLTKTGAIKDKKLKSYIGWIDGSLLSYCSHDSISNFPLMQTIGVNCCNFFSLPWFFISMNICICTMLSPKMKIIHFICSFHHLFLYIKLSMTVFMINCIIKSSGDMNDCSHGYWEHSLQNVHI